MSSNISKVIVFGATGPIGTSLIEIIATKQPSWQIVAVSRSGPKETSPLLKVANVTSIKGDVENLDTVQQLCEDVQLVFCTVGFAQYETKYWAQHWPVVIDNLLHVTSKDKPLVFCDNLYAYGARTDITTSSLTVEPSLQSKPGVRALLRTKLQARMDTSPQSIVVVGGSDFFGPSVTSSSFLGDTFVGNMVKGNKPLVVGTADAKHDFCCTRDFANALYVVSIHKDTAYGKFWICPHAIHNMTMRQIAEQVNGLLLEKPVKGGVNVMPVFMVYTLGIFMTFMRELKEMLPFWTKDYTVSDTAFADEFGIEATPANEALKEYIEFYKQRE